MFSSINIIDLLQSGHEAEVQEMLSAFSCEYSPKTHNTEVETFLKENAIKFAQQKISITYLVLNDVGELVGIYTLTHKPISVKDNDLSNTTKKKLKRYSEFDPELNAFVTSGFLIAQFSKNYADIKGDRISGNDLMSQALSDIKDIQKKIGGGIVFLECNDTPKLLQFYKNEQNLFREFGERNSKNDDVKYIQLLRVL